MRRWPLVIATTATHHDDEQDDQRQDFLEADFAAGAAERQESAS